MSEKQTGPRCIVFGGSGAVGSAICRVLAREGAAVAFTYHTNREAAAELAGTLPGAVAVPNDLADYGQTKTTVERCVEHLGGLDALVMAAGTAGDPLFYKCVGPSNYDKLQQVDQTAFDEMIAVNTRGVLAACQAAAPCLQAKGGGNMVIIGSMDGLKPVPSPIHFATSKAALRGMVEAMSKELGNHNIRVNIVAPGILEGGASRILGPEMTGSYLKHSSLKRFGRIEEVAELASWLAIENTYVTGQSILLDGGL